jgi:hypothetical protein
MATTQTTNLELYKPEVGGEEDNWGDLLNDNADVLDTWSAGVALIANNLSDLANAQTARSNLGLGTAAVYNDSRYNVRASNLSDVANKAAARDNLGANDASNLTTGTLPTARLPSTVPLQQSESKSADGDFTAGTIKFVRMGDVVTITSTGNLSHGSTTSASTSAGFVPSTYRPNNLIQYVESVDGGIGARVRITSSGTLSVSYTDTTDRGSISNSSTGRSVMFNYCV